MARRNTTWCVLSPRKRLLALVPGPPPGLGAQRRREPRQTKARGRGPPAKVRRLRRAGHVDARAGGPRHRLSCPFVGEVREVPNVVHRRPRVVEAMLASSAVKIAMNVAPSGVAAGRRLRRPSSVYAQTAEGRRLIAISLPGSVRGRRSSAGRQNSPLCSAPPRMGLGREPADAEWSAQLPRWVGYHTAIA